MSQLCVRDLCKEFVTAAERLQVLQGVDFQLEGGENMSIVGPSGCGKSTLLYILGTLDSPTSGSVEIDGQNPFDLPLAKLSHFRNRTIGFIFQDHHLLPQLSVTENVLLPALAEGTPSRESIDRAGSLVEAVGLADRAHHRPGQLSGGERQRVAVARALLHRPKLLLADEPTGNLDKLNTERIAEVLFDLPRREGAMLVVVTHSDWLASQAGRKMRLEDHQLLPV